MIKGMMTAAASVAYTLGLLLLMSYVFSIALVNLRTLEGDLCDWYVEDQGECEDLLKGNQCTCSGYFFRTVPEGIHNLVVFATFCDNLAEFIKGIKGDSPLSFAIIWLYIGLAALTVMNMLIGVLCEVISAVAAEEKESMMVDKVHEKFSVIVSQLDRNNDGTLIWDEFQKILEIPEAMDALSKVNVDPEAMVDMAEDYFFEDGEQVALTFEEFMNMVLDLRGGQKATVKDVLALRKRFSSKFLSAKSRMDGVEKKADNIDAKLGEFCNHLGITPKTTHETVYHVASNFNLAGLASPMSSTTMSGKLREAGAAKSDDKLS